MCRDSCLCPKFILASRPVSTVKQSPRNAYLIYILCSVYYGNELCLNFGEGIANHRNGGRFSVLQKTVGKPIFGYNPVMYHVNSMQRKRLSGNIFLVGMMGAGKTTVGKLLAQQLNKSFVDSDEEIQKRTGVTIPHIFDVEGEAGFRQREAGLMQDLVLLDNIVLATGGGAILNERSRMALCCNGIVVYLKSTVHDLWQRTRHDRNRPLLQTPDPQARLKIMYEQRDPLYVQMADLVMSTGKQSAQSLALQLQQELNRILEIKI